jgi:hypothetical protein
VFGVHWRQRPTALVGGGPAAVATRREASAARNAGRSRPRDLERAVTCSA